MAEPQGFPLPVQEKGQLAQSSRIFALEPKPTRTGGDESGKSVSFAILCCKALGAYDNRRGGSFLNSDLFLSNVSRASWV